MALAIVTSVFVCRLYRERLSQVNSKLTEVEAGRAAEYLEPLAVLLENMQVRTKVAGNFNTQTHTDKGSHAPAFSITDFLCFSPLPFSGIYRELCLESVKNKYECETQAASQHWEVRHTKTYFVALILVRTFTEIFPSL